MTDASRQDGREGFVLHTYPYRETSLIVEAFTRTFGRVSLLARGARRPRSPMRGVLLSFQPLLLSWFGKGELRTMARAEWVGGQPLLGGQALLCGFYLNELLLRLLPREDPHEILFAQYRLALQRLAAGDDSGSVLRTFEKALLKELGYAIVLDRDSAGREIDSSRTYRYDPERGPVEAAAGEPLVSGRTLLDMARDDYGDPVTQQQSKALMRALINHRLEHQPLRSRQVFRDLLQL
ncbi:MAG TPA: DNA repair protein RecO [Burkholderiales bacterium]|nr:DNA repair protein RecO [Burkholderiales bacterium]